MLESAGKLVFILKRLTPTTLQLRADAFCMILGTNEGVPVMATTECCQTNHFQPTGWSHPESHLSNPPTLPGVERVRVRIVISTTCYQHPSKQTSSTKHPPINQQPDRKPTNQPTKASIQAPLALWPASSSQDLRICSQQPARPPGPDDLLI